MNTFLDNVNCVKESFRFPNQRNSSKVYIRPWRGHCYISILFSLLYIQVSINFSRSCQDLQHYYGPFIMLITPPAPELERQGYYYILVCLFVCLHNYKSIPRIGVIFAGSTLGSALLKDGLNLDSK